MARAVIGGLITSTLLTLLVVPVMSTLLEDAVSWVRTAVPSAVGRVKRGGGGGAKREAPKPRAPQPRPAQPEHVAAMLRMAKESGKD
jgi:hypothetical protein